MAEIYQERCGIFDINYLGWSIKISIDRVDRIKFLRLQHQIGYFTSKNGQNSTYCDTQNLTYIRVDYSIPWMGGIPKIDIGISETECYTRIIFKNRLPEIISELILTEADEKKVKQRCDMVVRSMSISGNYYPYNVNEILFVFKINLDVLLKMIKSQ